MENLCKNGHDKNVVGTLKSGFCRECGRASRRAQWANATPEQKAQNRLYQRQRYEQGLTIDRIVTPLCPRGHVKAEVGVRKNGACKACNLEQDKALRENLTDEQKARHLETKQSRYTKWKQSPTFSSDVRALHLNYMYGITPDQYADMLASQRGLCAICGQPETLVRKGRLLELSVDHCHRTGINRKLLCSGCNTGLGKFRDSPEILIAAAEYLWSYAQT